MKTTEIKKRIDPTTSELEDLQTRLANVETDLTQKKKSIDLDDSSDREAVQSLKADRDLIQELIQEKRSQLEALNDDLEEQSAIEEREETMDKFEAYAKQAENFEKDFRENMIKADKILCEILPELARIRSEWKRIATAFARLAESSGLGRGISQSTTYSAVKNDNKESLNATQLIDELEADGVYLDAVLSDYVLRRQYFNHLRSGKSFDLKFRELLFEAISLRTVERIIQESES